MTWGAAHLFQEILKLRKQSIKFIVIKQLRQKNVVNNGKQEPISNRTWYYQTSMKSF